ncbi:MAG: alpha-amylase family glycosyl hydrolase, partial [Planctomycetota bacterium]
MNAVIRSVIAWALLACVSGVAWGQGAPSDLSSGVWRMAGTFNGWAAAQPDWTMAPMDDGTYELVRELPGGRHQFKFVRNGDWALGHFGLAEGGGLEQPGDNLTLDVRVQAVYRITLDPGARTWSFSVADLDQPVLAIDVLGVPTRGRALAIALDRSLATVDENGGGVRGDIRAIEGGTAMRLDTAGMVHIVTPGDVDRMIVEVRVTDAEGVSTSERLTLDVQPAYRIVVTRADGASAVIPVDALSPGLARGIVDLDPDIRSIELLEGETRRGWFEADGPVPVDPDRPQLAFEVREDGTRMVMGRWRRFTVPAGDATGGVLTGDFNGWAAPGSPEAIELTPGYIAGERVLFTTLELRTGAHRVVAELDHGERAIPRELTQTADGPGGLTGLAIAGRVPADFGEPGPNSIAGNAVLHDPTWSRDLRPIAEDLGLADIRVRTLPSDVSEATVLLETTKGEIEVPMRVGRGLDGFDAWTARIMGGSDILSYRIELRDGSASHTIGPIEHALDAPYPDTPDWAKGAVYYQIFAERFRNGNPANDPAGPAYFRMPWAADWYKTQPGEEEAWRVRAGMTPDEPLEPRTGGDLYHWVWDRRYGGDLQGVLEKLDHIKALGITAIYFNPVFEAESMHKYDATAFHHIDDNFAGAGPVPQQWTLPAGETSDPATWTWTEADRFFLQTFLPACKAAGIRVVIDGVWNHTGREFWAFRDVIENGADSDYARWFFANFDVDGDLESWQAWDQPSGWLPKFRQDSERNLVEPVKQHIFAVTRRWMDPNGDGDPSDGVDGWRLDVPLDVGEPFWEEWREVVKEVNHEAVIIAEIWHDADPWLRGDHFDTHMNYPFAEAITDWLAVEPGMTSAQLVERLGPAFDNGPQTNLIHQNLFASHDTDRYVSMLWNPGRGYDQGNRVQDGDLDYRAGRPPQAIFDLSRLGVAVQATYAGAPMVYYGDEVGMWGADDPTDRKPLPWPDMGPMVHPGERFDTDLLAHYRAWFGLRSDPRTAPVLRFGDLRHIDSNSDDVFAFVRSLNGVEVYVVVNRGERAFDAGSLVPVGDDALVERV